MKVYVDKKTNQAILVSDTVDGKGEPSFQCLMNLSQLDDLIVQLIQASNELMTNKILPHKSLNFNAPRN